MAATDIERPNYYPRQFLGAEDFIAEQSYQRDMRRRHNIGPHTWGIEIGLELVAGTPNPQGFSDVFVQPGVAIDGYGREIVVLAPYQLDPGLFIGLPSVAPTEVWIGFDDVLTQQPVGGYAQCDPTQQYGRVQETFRIVPAPAKPTYGPIIVGGTAFQPGQAVPPSLSIPADWSVPHQELPGDANSPLWLIYLGKVNWNGTGFVTGTKGNPATPPADSDFSGRTYIGAIASNLLSPEATLRIRPRTTPTHADDSDFASVEGRLRVDGGLTAETDIYLPNGKLQFQDRGALASIKPLWMSREPGNGLRIHLGDPDGTDTPQLTIGPGPEAAGSEPVTIAFAADKTVTIPDGVLSFGQTPRAMVKLGGKNELGTQPSTFYSRTDYGFAWYQGGQWAGSGNDPGGGSLLMTLDPSGLSIDAHAGGGGALTVGGSRTYLQGHDGTSNHWIMGASGPEPDFNALGFNPVPIRDNLQMLKQVKVGPQWCLQLQGIRTYVTGVDSANDHWVMAGGATEPDFNAIGFNPVTKTVLVGPQWLFEVQGNLKVDGTLSAQTAQVGQDVQLGHIVLISANVGNFGTYTLSVDSHFVNPSSAYFVIAMAGFVPDSVLNETQYLFCGSPNGTRDTNVPNRFWFDVQYIIHGLVTGIFTVVFEP